MYLLQSAPFTLKELLMGSEDWSFIIETVLRSFIMFIILLVSLRLLGKRGVKQLSVFELVVIIGLGSAAGDPMFYKDVGILPALVVFCMVVGLYTLVTRIVAQNKKVEGLIEGKSVYLIQDGVFAIQNFRKEVLSAEEFFAELRMYGVSQLGQIQEAIVETSGSISVFYYPDEEVKFGLPIMPGSLEGSVCSITIQDDYSCIFCGYTEKLQPAESHACPTCEKEEWVKASNRKRVA